VHRHGAALFFGKKETEMKTDKTSSRAEELLAELGLDYQCSEVGNMSRFVDQHRDKLRFIPENKTWAEWNRNRWKPCDFSRVHSFAIETIKRIYDEAHNCPTEEGSKRLIQWALRSETNRYLTSMIDMASKSPELITRLSTMDTNPLELNCRNGVVNLETGELREQTPSDRFLKLAPVNYQPDSPCPVFMSFLNDIFKGDKDLIAFIQRTIGYTLTGKTNEQVFFLAYGTGANGKSTLFETILSILGDYGKASEFDTFLANDKGNIRNLEGIARLQGTRYALASETDSTRRFSEALVKKITGGDTLTGAKLYGKAFAFKPEFKLWLLANHLPPAKDGSYGFWRRVKVIPFNRRFTRSDIDQTLPEKLQGESEGILAWCVRGAIQWSRALKLNNGASGLGSCDAVDQATSAYRSDNDLFSNFIEDCLERDKDGQIASTELYETYITWCDTEGEDNPCSRQYFGSRLLERGIKKKD